MKLNTKAETPPIFTHEGGRAVVQTPEALLRRSVMSCMLWEDTFYEQGVDIAQRIADLVPLVDPIVCGTIAINARYAMKLRHAPLLVVREMARHASHRFAVAETLRQVIGRPDEITEFLAIYWKDGKRPLAASVKRGLAAAFNKFGEYDFAKYDRDSKVKLRDALFLCHANPNVLRGVRYTKAERKLGLPPGNEREQLFQRIATRTLATPDTWEVALSGGADKRETFERLLRENKLGGLALLRNLRNMKEAGVPKEMVAHGLATMKVERILPYRFITAAKHAPEWEDIIEPAMLKCLAGRDKLPGRTILLVDVSGSMSYHLSERSEMQRIDAACGLAILARELCEQVEIHTFADQVKVVPPRHGFALRDAIHAQAGGGTYIGAAVAYANGLVHDRLIVITDEQSADAVPEPRAEGWMVNVAPYRHGVGFGPWNRVDGWSEAIFDFIGAMAGQNVEAAADE